MPPHDPHQDPPAPNDPHFLTTHWSQVLLAGDLTCLRLSLIVAAAYAD